MSIKVYSENKQIIIEEDGEIISNIKKISIHCYVTQQATGVEIFLIDNNEKQRVIPREEVDLVELGRSSYYIRYNKEENISKIFLVDSNGEKIMLNLVSDAVLNIDTSNMLGFLSLITTFFY